MDMVSGVVNQVGSTCEQIDIGYGTSILARQQNNEWCDIDLYGSSLSANGGIGNAPIKGHKVTLAAASPHLRDAFTVESFIESGAKEYTIEQIEHETLQLIVDFIYQSKLRVTGQDVFARLEKVLMGADYLLLPELVHVCGQALNNPAYLTSASCISKWSFAKKYHCEVLAAAAASTAAKDLVTVGKQHEFLNLPHEDMAQLIKNFAETPSTNCGKLSDAVVGWFEVDEATRKNLCDGVMRYMPFERLTSAGLKRLSAKKFLSADVVWKVQQMLKCVEFCALSEVKTKMVAVLRQFESVEHYLLNPENSCFVDNARVPRQQRIDDRTWVRQALNELWS